MRDYILTNETIFDLPDLPKSVGVIGAGPLGLELAQALVRLGVDTVVFDPSEVLGSLTRWSRRRFATYSAREYR